MTPLERLMNNYIKLENLATNNDVEIDRLRTMELIQNVVLSFNKRWELGLSTENYILNNIDTLTDMVMENALYA